MAPRETSKVASKVQPSTMKSTTSKGKSSPATTIKKRTVTKKPVEKVPINMNAAVEARRQRTSTAPTIATPKPKERNPVALSNSVTKSAKKPLWKRRPLPAHSGVPVPEKMKQLFKKQLESLNDSL